MMKSIAVVSFVLLFAVGAEAQRSRHLPLTPNPNSYYYQAAPPVYRQAPVGPWIFERTRMKQYDLWNADARPSVNYHFYQVPPQAGYGQPYTSRPGGYYGAQQQQPAQKMRPLGATSKRRR